MLKVFGFLGLLASVLALTPMTASQAKDDVSAHVEAEKFWARATIGGLRTIALYGRMINRTAQDDKLVAVSSPYAPMAAIHRTTIDDSGYMSMDEVDSVELPMNHFVQLEPGDVHIMMMRVDRKLVPGDEVPLRLEFENSEAVTVRAKVYPIKATWSDIQ